MKKVPFYLLLVVLGACSSRGVYEGIQTSNRLECGRLPPSQYDECMARNDTPYDEYRREREETDEP